MSDRDYYEILGLTPSADGAQVDQMYWHLAKKYQQLAATEPEAFAQLDQLNEAYGVLGTPRLREQYDAFRDDVLLTRGMVQPVRARADRPARPQQRVVHQDPGVTSTASEDRPSRGFPTIPNGRTYALTAVIVALALAAAWQGVNIVFVIGALVVGLILSLTPVLRRQLPEMHLTMPSITMPDFSSLIEDSPQEVRYAPGAGHPGTTVQDELAAAQVVGSDDLRSSTAAMIQRWRDSVGLRAPAVEDKDVETPAPDKTLVEIFQSEQAIEEDGEPLTSVVEILKGTHRNPARATQTD